MSDELPDDELNRPANEISESGDASSDAPPPPPGEPSSLSTRAVQGSDRTPTLSSPVISEEPPFGAPTPSENSSNSGSQAVSDPTTDHRQPADASSLRNLSSSNRSESTQPICDPETAPSTEPSSTSASDHPFSDPIAPDFSNAVFLTENASSHLLASNPSDPVPELNDQPIASGSCSHPADPEVKEEDLVDPSIVAEVLELGFDEAIIILALTKTKGVGGAESAVNWILEHSNESDFESDTEESLGAMGGTQSAFSSLRAHKMVFVANTSLKMGAGKLAAQVGHATLGVYRVAQRTEEGQRALDAWRAVGEMKVVVKGQSTEQLLELFKLARDAGLFAYVVADAGRTQIPAGSRTVLGIFGPSDLIDTITGQLKLL